MHDAPFNTAIPFGIILTYSLIPNPYTEGNEAIEYSRNPSVFMNEMFFTAITKCYLFLTCILIKLYSSTVFHNAPLHTSLHLRLSFQKFSTFQASRQKFQKHLSPLPVLHATLVSLSSIRWPQKYLANSSTNDETPYYSVLSFIFKHAPTEFYFPIRSSYVKWHK